MFRFFQSSYQKIKQALSKTRSSLGSRLRALFGKPWDDATFGSLEQILYEADLGTACVEDFVAVLKKELRLKPHADIQTILQILHAKARETLESPPQVLPKTPEPKDPLVILIVGVNGSGKTTSIAKLASNFQKQGKKVLVAAGDTFRAGAIDQLSLWAEKLKIDIVKSKPGSDPSAVAYDALSAAKARNLDVVLIDTAGRLQNKTDLMHELEKMKRVCQKLIPSSPHETLLVLDANTGQNALDQAQIFHQFVPLTGIILTKLDGSAKGGIILSIYKQMGVPVQWIGVGEKADDLIHFEIEPYLEALFDLGS